MCLFPEPQETIYPVLFAVITFVYFRAHEFRGDVWLLLETLVCVILTVIFHVSGHPWACSFQRSISNICLHALSAIVMVVSYRLSPLHPLASFPGPTIHKITSFKLAHVIYSGNPHIVIDALHKRHGVFVRTGPNTLSINSYNAVKPIYGTAQCMDKSDAYKRGRLTDDSLFVIRSRQQHHAHRRVWAGAFSGSALEQFSVIVDKRIHQLMKCIPDWQSTNGYIDLRECFSLLAYDIMGDFVFGASNRTELIRDGDKDGIAWRVKRSMVDFEVLGQVPSLFDIVSYMPATKDYHGFRKSASRYLQSRKQIVSKDDMDLCSYLLGDHDHPGQPDPIPDTIVAMAAGGDTTAGALTLLLYHLILHRGVYDTLTEELVAYCQDGVLKPKHHAELQSLPYLSAVTNESLRLGSPVIGLSRVVPGNGVILEGHFIPRGTTINVPIWSQHICPDNFSPVPREFKPERWLPGGLGPDTITRPAALINFSSGPFGCIGRAFAIRELHVAVAQFLLSYHLQFAPTFDPSQFISGVLSARTVVFPYPLLVEARRRIK